MKGLGKMVLAMSLGLAGCTNAQTPEGHEGYVFMEPGPLLFEGKFVGTQKGPSSYGLSWRKEVTNIDMRPQTYTEYFEVRTLDNLDLHFTSNANIRLAPGSVKEIVEQYAGENWYQQIVQQQYRSAVREEVHKINSGDVKEKAPDIATKILTQLQEEFTGTPFQINSMDITNIAFPDQVNNAVMRKLATEQDYEKVKTEFEIAKKQADILRAEADGLRKAQDEVMQSLTPLYLQHKSIKAYEHLADSGNTTFIYAPMGTDGSSSPVIVQMPQRSMAPKTQQQK